jgi:hypothetical protein
MLAVLGSSLLWLQSVWFARPWQIFVRSPVLCATPYTNPDFQGQFFKHKN